MLGRRPKTFAETMRTLQGNNLSPASIQAAFLSLVEAPSAPSVACEVARALGEVEITLPAVPKSEELETLDEYKVRVRRVNISASFDSIAVSYSKVNPEAAPVERPYSRLKGAGKSERPSLKNVFGAWVKSSKFAWSASKVDEAFRCYCDGRELPEAGAIRDGDKYRVPTTKRDHSYARYITQIRKKLAAGALRKSLPSLDKLDPTASSETHDRAHVIDLEFASDVLFHVPGRRLSFPAFSSLVDLLNSKANLIALSSDANRGKGEHESDSDRSAVERLKEAFRTKQIVTLKEHETKKVKLQLEFLTKHRDAFKSSGLRGFYNRALAYFENVRCFSSHEPFKGIPERI